MADENRASGRSDVTGALVVTIAALTFYRLGAHVPLPGLDPTAVAPLSGVSTRAVERLSVFALGVTPLFSALLLFELGRYLLPQLRRWEMASPTNATRMRDRARALALGFAALQGLGIATALEGMTPRLVLDPGWSFRVPVIATYVAATALLSWLADQITKRGLGNGFWLLLAVPAIGVLPETAAQAWQLAREGMISTGVLLLGPVWLAVAIVVLVTLDRTRHPLVPKRSLGGVWPPILAYTILSWIIGIAFAFAPHGTDYHALWLAPGQPAYLALLAAIITGFAVLRLSAPIQGQPGSEDAMKQAALRRLGLNAGLVQAGVCISGELLSQITPLVMRGMWLIIIVTLALRIGERTGITPSIREAGT